MLNQSKACIWFSWEFFYILNLLIKYFTFKFCKVGICWFSWDFFGPYMNSKLDSILITENHSELNRDSLIFLGACAGISEAKICWFFNIVLNHWKLFKVSVSSMDKTLWESFYISCIWSISFRCIISLDKWTI